MNLFGISINHRTAPVEIREAINLSDSEIQVLVPILKKELFSSGYILSTCNRTEIFGFPALNDLSHNKIKEHIINFKKSNGVRQEHFVNFKSYDAVAHIMRVASGLDSMMLGDSQILSQVKMSFKLAEELEFTGPVLNRIFNTAVITGKRAISETKIGEGATTISYAAVQLVEKIFSNFARKKVLVIGAGETSELVITYLKDKETGNITITNRTLSKAEEIAGKYKLNVLEFEKFREHISEFDIIFSATSSDIPLVNFSDVSEVMKKRKHTPLCIIDIAIPRDFEPAAGEIENVFYNDIDSLNRIVEQNMNRRKAEIPKVQKIIDEELEELKKWFNSLQIVPTIKSFHSFFESIRDDEMKKLKNKIGNKEIEKIDEMSRRLVTRLVGNPTSKLREISEKSANNEKTFTYTLLLKELFNLK